MNPWFPNILYANYSDLYKRTYQGNSGNWTQVSDFANDFNLNYYDPLTSIDIAPNNPEYIYVAVEHMQGPDPSEFLLFKTATGGYDNGCTTGCWSELFPPNPHYITGIAVSPYDENKIWISYAGYDENDKVKYYDGNTWLDYSEGLPNLPVNEIIFYNGSVDGLFVAVDDGVYYRNATMDQWEPFKENLPNVNVRDLEINYKSNNIKAGTFGRGLWESPLPCIYLGSSLQINNDQTWNVQMRLDRDIVITANNTLTIDSNAVIYFPSSAKIVVKRGGKLIIDGGRLTNACDGELWQGIELHGTTTEPQLPQYQGIVQIENGGTIENAVCGIKTYKPKLEGDGGEVPDQMFAGGIIWANSANFVNNITAVEFLHYEDRSISTFTKCVFETNQDAIDLFEPEHFIKMTSIDGISIKGCIFKNTKDSGTPDDGFGYGIYATNSQFYVNHKCLDEYNPCENFQRSSFENLYYGIYSKDIGYNKLLKVENSDFINNLKGAYIGENAGAIELLSNNFELAYPASAECYGLYLDHCTGYHVEDNDMYCNLSSQQGIGMYINNSGTEDNMIYRNYMTNLEYGIATLDINRRQQEGGLCVKCNTFTDNLSDLSVNLSGTLITLDHGIALHQGTMDPSDDAPAGNIFSDFQDHEWDIYNEGRNIHYVYHNRNTTPEKVQPVLNSGNVTTEQNFSAHYSDDACPSTIDLGGGADEQRETMAQADSSINALNSDLSQLVDGGNTDDLNTDVEMSTPPEAVYTRDQLLGESPYLSDTVMKTAISKENVLPNAMVRDVLVANPQSAKSDDVLSELDKRFDPMPDYMMDEIMAGKDSMGSKELLEAERAFHFQQRAGAFNKLIRIFKQDTNILIADSLLPLYDEYKTLINTYRKSFAPLSQGDTSAMQMTLTAIPDSFDLTSTQQSVHLNYQWFLNLLKQLGTDTMMIYHIDTSSVNELICIAMNDEGMPGRYATAILLALDEVSYSEPVNLPSSIKSATEEPGYKQYNRPEEEILEIYPNPAYTYIIVKYCIPQKTTGKSLSINNLKGNCVYTKQLQRNENEVVVPVKDLSSGTYIVSIEYNGKSQQAKKVSIIH